MVIINGDAVRLRPIERSDVERWRTWINDPEIAGYLDRVLPVTSAEHEAFFERAVIGNDTAVWYAIEDAAGQYVGNVWLWNVNGRHRSAELRIVIGERSAWGTGIGRASIEALTTYAFDSLGLHKVYAYVMARNPRAVKSFERAGYVREALLHDEVFWNGVFEDVHRLYKLGPQ